MKRGFLFRVARWTHGRIRNPSCLHILLCGNFVMHNPPNKQRLWRRNVWTPKRLGPITFWSVPYLNKKASLKERSPILLFIQTSLSSINSIRMVTCSTKCFNSRKEIGTEKGKFHWWLTIKSLTLALRFCWKMYMYIQLRSYRIPTPFVQPKVYLFPITNLPNTIRMYCEEFSLNTTPNWWEYMMRNGPSTSENFTSD